MPGALLNTGNINWIQYGTFPGGIQSLVIFLYFEWLLMAFPTSVVLINCNSMLAFFFFLIDLLRTACYWPLSTVHLDCIFYLLIYFLNLRVLMHRVWALNMEFFVLLLSSLGCLNYSGGIYHSGSNIDISTAVLYWEAEQKVSTSIKWGPLCLTLYKFALDQCSLDE